MVKVKTSRNLTMGAKDKERKEGSKKERKKERERH